MICARLRFRTVLFSTILCLLMAACGKDKAAPSATSTTTSAAPETSTADAKSITIWWAQWAPADGLQELGDAFTKETGIGVKVHQIPWSEFQTQVFIEFSKSKTKFDIVVGDSQWIGRGATKKLYVDLSDWIGTAVDLNAVHPRAKKYLCEYPPGSGKFFAAPCETDAVGFAYRKDWFNDPAEQKAFEAKYGRKLAVPETWQEFRDIAEFFTRPDKKRYGCVLLTGRGYDSLTMGFQQVMWAFGGSWGDPSSYKIDGHVNNEGAVKGLSFFKSLMAFGPKDAANSDYGKCLESFLNGSTAISMNYFAFNPAIQKALGDKVGFFKVPSHNGKRVISLGGQGFSISTKVSAEQQALAKQFIAWFLDESQQKEWITKDAGFTANTAILNSDAFKSATPYNAPFAESLNHVQDFWNVPIYNELLEVSQRFVAEALDGRKEPKAALDAIAKEHEALFKEAGLLK